MKINKVIALYILNIKLITMIKKKSNNFDRRLELLVEVVEVEQESTVQ